MLTAVSAFGKSIEEGDPEQAGKNAVAVGYAWLDNQLPWGVNPIETFATATLAVGVSAFAVHVRRSRRLGRL